MSKRTFFKRYLWLIDTITHNPYIKYEEIEDRFNRSDLKDDSDPGFSKRTFHRDIEEITDIFGIEVYYDKAQRGYTIVKENVSSHSRMLLDSCRFINTSQIFKNAGNFIATETGKTGSEHLLLILDAILNRKRIEFTYQKYTAESAGKRTVEPYFIKDFKGRWYVIARDQKDRNIKIFALERIINDPVAVSPSASFDFPVNLKPDLYFRDSFGIIHLDNTTPEEIELSFSPFKGKFIKSQALHHTQKVITDNEKEFRIKLNLQVTHDFVMEILSHGSDIRVISPESLQEKVIQEYKKALKQYKS